MKKVLVIGATGSVGRVVTETLLNETDDKLVLFSRHVAGLRIDSNRGQIVTGNALNENDIAEAATGVDAVFVALSGDMAGFAKTIVDVLSAMQPNAPKLIFVTTMGIYQEIPSWLGASPEPYGNPILGDFRRAADVIETSSLNYTIIRPGWYTNGPVNYELTKKGEPFGGHDVSRKSIADLVKRATDDLSFGNHESFGINEK